MTTTPASRNSALPASPTTTPPPTAQGRPLLSEAEGDLEIPQVTMDVVLNHLDRRLLVTQGVLLVNRTADAWSEVVFSVIPAHAPGVFSLDHVDVTTRWNHATVPTTLDGIMLHVPLPAPVRAGELVSLTLVYGLRIPTIDATASLPEGNLGAGERVIQVGDWHPTLVPYRAGAGWQTWSYYPVGDPTIYPVADYDVRLTVGPRVIVAAPGVETRDGAVRRYRLQGARCFAFLASTDYQVLEDSASGVPLRVYYLPGYAQAAQAVLDTAARAIDTFDDLFGPYPAQGLVAAQNAYNGSMEYSGLISLSTQAFRVYGGGPRALLVSLTAHEIAHQWWYGAVGNDQVHDPWMDEALAKYSELLFYERISPELSDWWWETHIYLNDPSGPIDRTIYDFESTSQYTEQVYSQGARFLQDLRARVGDKAFFAFLRDYREVGEGRLMGPHDFFAVLRAHTDEDLQPLIARYFETPVSLPAARPGG